MQIGIGLPMGNCAKLDVANPEKKNQSLGALPCFCLFPTLGLSEFMCILLLVKSCPCLVWAKPQDILQRSAKGEAAVFPSPFSMARL
jgi:hypothetical protein